MILYLNKTQLLLLFNFQLFSSTLDSKNFEELKTAIVDATTFVLTSITLKKEWQSGDMQLMIKTRLEMFSKVSFFLFRYGELLSAWRDRRNGETDLFLCQLRNRGSSGSL